MLQENLATILANMNRNSALSPSSLALAATASPPEMTTNLYADLISSAAGLPFSMLTPHIITANQWLAARANSSAVHLYAPSLFPWQVPPIINSPPISPISLAHSTIENKSDDDMVTTTTAATVEPASSERNREINFNYLNDNHTDFANENIDRLGARITANFMKNRNPILYQPYTMDVETTPVGIMSPTSGSSDTSPPPKKNPSTIASTAAVARGRPFKCQLCNRSFGYKHVLQNHMRTHTGEKPYSCRTCGKRFTRDHHLKTHMRLHTGETPYHCPHCPQKFVQVANLRRHLRKHTGVKPYVCDRCDCKYSDSNQLKAHIFNNHKNDKPFQCGMCGANFWRNHHLANHKCANHNATPLTPATSPDISPNSKSSVSSRSETVNSEQTMELLHSYNINSFKHYEMNRKNLNSISLHTPTYQTLQQMYDSKLSVISNECSNNEIPLDLSSDNGRQRNNHKASTDPRYVECMPKSKKIDLSEMSEQTKPEDLSMHLSRFQSPLLNEEDFDDLDDAKTLNRKQKKQQANQ